LLKRICRDFGSIDASFSGWKVIGPGIRKTYRDGRRAYRVAQETGAPEDFHDWRKRAKDSLYQTGFLCGMWPEQMDALQNELKKLGDYLGDAHDLSVLTGPETLKQLASQPKEEIETLKTLTARRQKELQAKALQLGAKLYHESSDRFCERLRQYWRRWRRKRTPARA
jgi:CHAD domain-containing protein